MEPGNIWSGSDALAVLTNPTELAFSLGNLKGHYPIIVDGKEFADVEDYYQQSKGDGDRSFAELEAIMVTGMVAKFRRYLQIVEFIDDNGGIEWLEKCSHHVNGGRWEGDGLESPFIRCLVEGYRVAKASE